MPEGGLLLVFAHPDDETFGVGGAMARYADAGVPVTMICATRGEVGQIADGVEATPETLGAVREAELREALAHLGVHDVRFLGFRDSGMDGTPDNDHPQSLHRAPAERVVEPLVTAIRELRPSVVVTWDPTGGYGHPDHVAVHRHTVAAVEAAADAARWPDAGDPWRTPALFYTVIPIEEFVKFLEEMRAAGVADAGDTPGDADMMLQLKPPPVNTVLDVTEHFDRKMRALFSHRSQMNDIEMIARAPEHLQRRFFSRETFHRAMPPVQDGHMLDDLFAGM
jgi:LmbE family N-acetylglucosaminyl deacetylase